MRESNHAENKRILNKNEIFYVNCLISHIFLKYRSAMKEALFKQLQIIVGSHGNNFM